MVFGLGLLSIGRRWGVQGSLPPNQEEALELIAKAVEIGVHFFDTAPAYGNSEKILGTFLRSKTAPDHVTVATKMGEFWQGSDLPTLVCHEENALKESIDQSLEHLGSIHILQVHKATRDVIECAAVHDAIAYAKQRGITQFGASVSDVDSAKAAIESGAFQWLQFPFNAENRAFGSLIGGISKAGMRAMINRPLAMGKLAHTIAPGFQQVYKAGFPDGSVLLSGTGSSQHLQENFAAFRALSRVEI